jgi:hypothetical protein
MRPVARGFVDAFSHPGVIAGLGTAHLAAWLGVRRALSGWPTVGIGGALGLAAAVLLFGRAWRALALATSLPRVTRGAWPDPARALVGGSRILVLDLIEGTLVTLLGVAALRAVAAAAQAQRAPLVIAAALAPMLFLGLAAFGTFRQATIEVALAGAPVHEALGRAFCAVLGRPREMLAVQAWLVPGLLPLLAAASLSAALLPLALAASAAALWGYAALHRLGTPAGT